MLIVNLNAMANSQVVGVVMSKGVREDCLYEMCEMLYQIMKDEELLHVFDDAVTMVQVRLQEEGK